MQCPTGKSPFATLAQAKTALKRMHDRNHNHVSPFLCTTCGAWHLGSHQAGRYRVAKRRLYREAKERQL